MDDRSRTGTRPIWVLALSLLALWLCWGSSIPATRVMVETLPPLLASGAVFATAGLLLACTCASALVRATKVQLGTAAGIGLCYLGAQGVAAIAVQHLYAGTVALLVASIPLWVMVLGVALGDRPTAVALARLALGFAGVAVVVLAAPEPQGWTGWGLLVLAAAALWAAGVQWAHRSTALLPSAQVTTAVHLLAGGAMLLVAGTLRGELAGIEELHVSVASWGAVGYLVLFDSLAGFVLFTWLLRVAPPAVVSTYAYAVPVVAYLVGWLVLGEPFHPVVVLGAAVVLLAVAGELRAQHRARAAASSG